MLYDHALPGDSATKTAMRDQFSDAELAEFARMPRDGHGRWSHEALLQATEIDVLRMILHVLVVANRGTSERPEPWPRPGVVTRKPRTLIPAARDYLRRLVAEHEALHGTDEVSAED